MSDETKPFVGANLIKDAAHEFTAEEIAYIEQNDLTIQAVRDAIGRVNAAEIGDGISLDALIGEAELQEKEPEGTVDADDIDPAAASNEGKTGADSAKE